MTQREINNIEAQVAVIANDVKWIKEQITTFQENYVTRSEFWPVRVIAYSVVGAAGLALLKTIIDLAINHKVV